MIKLVVADANPVALEAMAALVLRHDGLAIVGKAHTGADAIAVVAGQRPDLAVLNVNLAGLDGLAATVRIMELSPTPLILLVPAGDAGPFSVAVQAIRAGALATLPPVSPATLAAPGIDSDEALRLVTTIRAMSQVKVVRRRPSLGALRAIDRAAVTPLRRLPVSPGSLTPLRGSFRAVAIAASTGGPSALKSILEALPGDFPAPIFVVQHMAKGFTNGLASWLDGYCKLAVITAEHEAPLIAGRVYIAPDDAHLSVAGGAIALDRSAPVGGFRPSATPLFRGLAHLGSGLVAVILTGMGDDGVAGLHRVREFGGTVLAQSEPSCVVFGMPKAAIDAGVVDLVIPLEEMAQAILYRVSRPAYPP